MYGRKPYSSLPYSRLTLPTTTAAIASFGGAYRRTVPAWFAEYDLAMPFVSARHHFDSSTPFASGGSLHPYQPILVLGRMMGR